MSFKCTEIYTHQHTHTHADTARRGCLVLCGSMGPYDLVYFCLGGQLSTSTLRVWQCHVPAGKESKLGQRNEGHLLEALRESESQDK